MKKIWEQNLILEAAILTTWYVAYGTHYTSSGTDPTDDHVKDGKCVRCKGLHQILCGQN